MPVINTVHTSVVDFLVTGVAYLSLTLLALAFAKKAWQWHKDGWSSHGFSLTTSFRRSRQQTIPRELDAPTRALFEKRQLKFSRQAIHVGCMGLTAIVMAYLAVKHIDWSFDQDSASLDFGQGHMMLLSLTIVVQATCLSFESQPGNAMRIVVNIIAMCRMMATALAYETSEQLLFDRYNVLVGRLCVAIIIGGGLRLTISMNVLLAGCQIAAWANFEEQLDIKYGNYSFLWFVVHELLLGLILCVVPGALEQCAWAEAHANIQMKADRSMARAVRGLLSRSYDVVVHLDEDLVIQDDAFDFSSFLMRGVNNSVKGRNMSEFLHAEDDQFESSLREARSEVVGPIYVELRDASGTNMSVEVVHATFPDLEDNIQHLVGICEKTKETELPVIDEDFHSTGDRGLRVKQRSIALKGTPATLEKHPMHQSEVSAGCDTESTSSDASTLADPEFLPVSLKTRSLSLLNLLHSWNVALPPVTCCEYHALVKEVSHQVARFRRQECWSPSDTRQLRQHFTHQCQECGILLVSGVPCHLCPMLGDAPVRSTKLAL
eukprot:TRINITY_DN7868_c0_g1_i1.p1 TRINITY_DN7868_c0_g1~~TRINITY_DN7868_c0_g1_i1.p1  ORF type:complete len:548 (+),score=45.60 TRINITY_DN7868_c0_g1_i1:81-1724(+)